MELSVKCNIFKKKLDGIKLTNHIVTTIISRLGKELSDWIGVQQDMVSTNKATLDHIKETLTDVNISKNFCCSHILGNTWGC